jgi:hypothetical protein
MLGDREEDQREKGVTEPGRRSHKRLAERLAPTQVLGSANGRRDRVQLPRQLISLGLELVSVHLGNVTRSEAGEDQRRHLNVAGSRSSEGQLRTRDRESRDRNREGRDQLEIVVERAPVSRGRIGPEIPQPLGR